MGLTASALQLIGTGATAITGALGSVSQAQAQRAASRVEGEALKTQEIFAREAAQQTKARGRLEAGQQRQRTRQLIGSQRAALAAQGIDVESGTAAELQTQSAALGAAAAATIQNNAFREALGLEVQAEEFAGLREIGKRTGRAKARSTLLTGGIRFAREAFGGVTEFAEDPYFTKAARQRAIEERKFQARLVEGERPRSRVGRGVSRRRK